VNTLADGARLAVWEISQPEESPLPWPLPWSLDGSDSFVVSADVLRESIEAGGFLTHDRKSRDSAPASRP